MLLGTGKRYVRYRRPLSGRTRCTYYICIQMVNCLCSTYVVQFVVKTASVANGFAVLVSPPQRRGGRFAIGATGPGSASGRL